MVVFHFNVRLRLSPETSKKTSNSLLVGAFKVEQHGHFRMILNKVIDQCIHRPDVFSFRRQNGIEISKPAFFFEEEGSSAKLVLGRIGTQYRAFVPGKRMSHDLFQTRQPLVEMTACIFLFQAKVFADGDRCNGRDFFAAFLHSVVYVSNSAI